ncbi:putative F420-0 ABC transporter permease subunit [Microbacterium sp. EST19A]|uniref:putative F420-0 ABC transporter permease subunit n=1 Tax=Microbacterium sp. EST19A TaxID=2862681 RepID=UPI0035ABCFB8
MSVAVAVPMATAAAPPRAARKRSRTASAVTVLMLALAGTVVAAVAIGPAAVSPAELAASVWSHLTGAASGLSPIRDAIIWEGRVPRVLTAAAVGGGLALCGAVMQALTHNPLADPYLLGLSSGASTGAVIVIVLGAAVALPFAAFAGALIALALTLGLSRAAGSATSTAVVLAGLAVSAVLSALTSLVIFWSATNDSYREILSWLLGSLGGADWADAALAGAAVVVCAVPLLASARPLDSLALGDTAAEALGIPVVRVRVLLFVCTALLTGALVAVSGSIGFVGLILPHAVRAVVGARHRAVLPVSLLAGAVFLIWADTIARTVFEPRELPVGIVTALIGGPVFALLLLRKKTRS